MLYSMEQLYQLAMEISEKVVRARATTAGIVMAIAVFLAVLLICSALAQRKGCAAGFLPALIIALFSFFLVRGNVPKKVDRIGHDLANIAINEGVDQARDAQATELQYIHAVVVQYGADRVDCQRTVNSKGPCTSRTPYYSTRDINPHDCNCTDVCDSRDDDGDCTSSHEVCQTCYDTEYTPYFAYLSRYWIVPDTKTKYLHPGVYQMESSGPKAKPKVFVSDWRAPEYPAENTFRNRGLNNHWKFNSHVPEFWTRVRESARPGGPVVVANFVGSYFHWGHAAESAQFAVYDGHYQQLRNLAQLPGPNGVNGVNTNYTDAFNRPAVMHTLLTTKDGELALDFQPIIAIGVNLDPALRATLEERAMEFQGHAGPNKETSVRWVLFADSVVQGLGSLRDAAMAAKAYLNDDAVWGSFKLPKNQIINVASVSDDGRFITGRDFETGMPFGNVLVAQRIRLSMEAGQTLPLTPENLFGSFQARYVSNDESGNLAYEYSDMSAAGAVIGLLYESTPGYEPPDPDSDECTSAPPEHLGFIRYQMCTQEYRKSTIQIKEDGAQLILAGVEAGAKRAVPVMYAWVILVVVIFGWIGAGWVSQSS